MKILVSIFAPLLDVYIIYAFYWIKALDLVFKIRHQFLHIIWRYLCG